MKIIMKRQIITTVLLVNLLFIVTNVFAQKHTTIIYRYNQDSIKQDSFYIPIMKILGSNSFEKNSLYQDKFISFNKKKDYSETIYDLLVKDTTCAFMMDLFGHENFVIPGDTMVVNITGKAPRHVNNFTVIWSYNLSYEGRNKYVYSLFDSLAYNFGELRFNYLHFNKGNDLDAFCKKADSVYTQQSLFLEQYCKRHNIGDPFKNLAQTEIHAAYIANLVRPMHGYDVHALNEFSNKYRDVLLKSGFNDPNLYFKTSIYSSMAYTYTLWALPPKKLGTENSDLIALYKITKQNYTDTIRNHLITVILSDFLRNPKMIYPCFDSLLTDFKSICTNQLYTHRLDSLNIARKELGVKKYSLPEAMASQIADTKGQQLKVKQLFKSKPLLLICWASWCAPCIREIPGEKKMQDLYGDKVDFVYLSFDKSNKLWQDKLKTLTIKDGNNYILADYFNSNFAHFYDINAIPFYLLYDKTGKKVEIKDLRPSNEGFKDILEKLIQ
jgi:thiol-disulfide isomerase/thioredoxin